MTSNAYPLGTFGQPWGAAERAAWLARQRRKRRYDVDVLPRIEALNGRFDVAEYGRIEAEGGLQWPCYDETHPGELFLHSRLWEDPVPGNRAPFIPVDHDPPVDRLDDEFPIRLTTGRRLDSYNTGVQSGGYPSPLRRGETLDISPEDAERYGLAEGERVRVVSRRGAVEVAVRIDETLRPGLTFMTLHFQDDVATNLLTIDATDPKSGTAEFKATAIRIERLAPAPAS